VDNRGEIIDILHCCCFINGMPGDFFCFDTVLYVGRRQGWRHCDRGSISSVGSEGHGWIPAGTYGCETMASKGTVS
jgi:hypothetical protein